MCNRVADSVDHRFRWQEAGLNRQAGPQTSPNLKADSKIWNRGEDLPAAGKVPDLKKKYYTVAKKSGTQTRQVQERIPEV